MVLIIRGRLPSGMWAAWAGSQDSGHLAPTGGRLQECVCAKDSLHRSEPHSGH